MVKHIVMFKLTGDAATRRAVAENLRRHYATFRLKSKYSNPSKSALTKIPERTGT